jgi:hypothetical protein
MARVDFLGEPRVQGRSAPVAVRYQFGRIAQRHPIATALANACGSSGRLRPCFLPGVLSAHGVFLRALHDLIGLRGSPLDRGTLKFKLCRCCLRGGSVNAFHLFDFRLMFV